MGNSDMVNGKSLISVTFAPVEVDDVPVLVQVHTMAFKTDQFSYLMLLNREEDAHQVLMQKSIKHWMSDPNAKLTKAVDADGNVLGWSCWISKRGDVPGVPAPAPDSTKKSSQEDAKGSGTGDSQQREAPNPPQDPARVLGGLMYKDMISAEATHLSGKRYTVLQALATDPRYQRRGIATRLVQQGLEEVDSVGLPCWIHASPSSYSLYERLGFEEVGKSVYDLAEWAPGDKSENRGWGYYTFRYMLRPAPFPSEFGRQSI